MAENGLTDRSIRSIKPDAARQVDYPDGGRSGESGLALRVSPKGKMAWVFRYRNAAGKQKRLTFGSYPSMSLQSARAKVRGFKIELEEGADPAAEKRRKRTAEVKTLDDLAEKYWKAVERGAHKAHGKPKRPRTIELDQGRYDKHINPVFGDSLLGDIRRADIRELVEGLIEDGHPATANGCLAVIRQLFSYALYTDRVELNPALGIGGARLSSRERVLSDAELVKVWSAASDPESIKDLSMTPRMGCALMLAAVTLQRIGEVVSMDFSELDLRGISTNSKGTSSWTIPSNKTKNGRTHVVPLSNAAVWLIYRAHFIADLSFLSLLSFSSISPDDLPELPASGPVFPSPRKPGEPVMSHSASRAMTRLMEAVGIEDARAHDLRRTGSTNLTSERLCVSRFIVSRVLNHVSDMGGGGGATPVYDRYEYLAEKRRALDAWADLLLRIVEGKARPDNVVSLSRPA